MGERLGSFVVFFAERPAGCGLRAVGHYALARGWNMEWIAGLGKGSEYTADLPLSPRLNRQHAIQEPGTPEKTRRLHAAWNLAEKVGRAYSHNRQRVNPSPGLSGMPYPGKHGTESMGMY